jgi:hypothetical protein
MADKTIEDYEKICAVCMNGNIDVSSPKISVKTLTTEMYCGLTLKYKSRTDTCDKFRRKY